MRLRGEWRQGPPGLLAAEVPDLELLVLVQQDGRHVRDSVALRAGQSVPSVDDQYGSAGLADPGKDQGTLQVGARDVVLVQPDGASSRNPCRGSMRRGGRARAICWALVTSHPKPRNWKY
jgi:hypothetical protein